jgi:hypothetical protein
MKRTRLATGIIVAAAGIIAAALTAWYLFYRPLPGISHATHLTPSTAIRVVLQPARVQGYVSRLAPTATRYVKGIPRLTSMQPGPIRLDWIHTLPYEFTLLFAQDAADFQTVLLFVKENPDGRNFAGVLNDSSLFRDLRAVDWPSHRVRADKSGALLASGSLVIPEDTQAAVEAAWPRIVPARIPEVEGDHFLEIAADNGNGALMEIHGALAAAYGPWGGPELQQALRAAWPAIDNLRLSADLEEDDRLAFTLRVQTVREDARDSVQAAATQFAAEVEAWLRDEEGFVFSGETKWTDPYTLTGHYRLTGFEPNLRRALGG